MVGALGVLVGFFLLVGWVIPLSRQLARQENVLLMLADQVLAESDMTSCPDARLRILTPAGGESFAAGIRLPVIGTATFPDAFRYRVEVRAAGATGWTLLEARRRATGLGQLAGWDSEGYAPSRYEMRLTAVDRNNIPLAGSVPCAIELELRP
jgi:hypothetical protein